MNPQSWVAQPSELSKAQVVPRNLVEVPKYLSKPATVKRKTFSVVPMKNVNTVKILQPRFGKSDLPSLWWTERACCRRVDRWCEEAGWNGPPQPVHAWKEEGIEEHPSRTRRNQGELTHGYPNLTPCRMMNIPVNTYQNKSSQVGHKTRMRPYPSPATAGSGL